MKGLKGKIRKLVSEDKLSSAINLLIEEFKDKEDLNEILIQSARHANLERDSMNSTIDKEKYDTEINSIRRNLLSFAEKIEVEKGRDVTGIDAFKNDFKYAIARVKLAKLFLENYPTNHSMTISWLHKNSKIKSRKLVFDFVQELKENELVERRESEDGVCYELNEKGKKILKKLSK